jgi:hypothetical protein
MLFVLLDLAIDAASPAADPMTTYLSDTLIFTSYYITSIMDILGARRRDACLDCDKQRVATDGRHGFS